MAAHAGSDGVVHVAGGPVELGSGGEGVPGVVRGLEQARDPGRLDAADHLCGVGLGGGLLLPCAVAGGDLAAPCTIGGLRAGQAALQLGQGVGTGGGRHPRREVGVGRRLLAGLEPGHLRRLPYDSCGEVLAGQAGAVAELAEPSTEDLAGSLEVRAHTDERTRRANSVVGIA